MRVPAQVSTAKVWVSGPSIPTNSCGELSVDVSRVTTNVHFLTVDDYGTTLQEIQGNREGPST